MALKKGVVYKFKKNISNPNFPYSDSSYYLADKNRGYFYGSICINTNYNYVRSSDSDASTSKLQVYMSSQYAYLWKTDSQIMYYYIYDNRSSSTVGTWFGRDGGGNKLINSINDVYFKFLQEPDEEHIAVFTSINLTTKITVKQFLDWLEENSEPVVNINIGELENYGSLPDGNYTIKAVASFDGCADSDKSLELNYTKYPKQYNIELTGYGSYGFRASSNIANPDSTKYDGVYESVGYYNNDISYAKITFKGYPTFNLYIGANKTGKQWSPHIQSSFLDIANYSYCWYLYDASSLGRSKVPVPVSEFEKAVYYNDGGEHCVYILYKESESESSTSNRRGYFLIEK